MRKQLIVTQGVLSCIKLTMITIRKALPNENEDFAKLMLISAPWLPLLFGDKIKIALKDLFQANTNLFSYQHVYFAYSGSLAAGMILSYDWQTKKSENIRTGLLLLKKSGIRLLLNCSSLLRFNATVGTIAKGEYYISNLATYPQFQGKGAGKELIFAVEQQAKTCGATKVILDVEKENITAINIYQNLGYNTEKEFSIILPRGHLLPFKRMVKEI